MRTVKKLQELARLNSLRANAAQEPDAQFRFRFCSCLRIGRSACGLRLLWIGNWSTAKARLSPHTLDYALHAEREHNTVADR